MIQYTFTIHYDYDHEGWYCRATLPCGGQYHIAYGETPSAALERMMAAIEKRKAKSA